MRHLIVCLTLLVLCLGLAHAQWELITFEDQWPSAFQDEFGVTHPEWGYSFIPSPYAGLEWSFYDWVSIDWLDYLMLVNKSGNPDSGYVGTINGELGVATPYAANMSFGGTPFTLYSMRVGAAWKVGMYAHFIGYRDGAIIYNQYLEVPYGGTSITLDFRGIDSFEIYPDTATGTDHHAPPPEQWWPYGHEVVMDDIFVYLGTATLNSTLVAYDTTAINGQTTQLNAKLTATVTGGPLPGRTIYFSVAGVYIGTGTTGASGVAAIPYPVTSVGDKLILARFNGDPVYYPSSDTATLTCNPAPPTSLTLTLNPDSVTSGGSTTCTVMGDNGVDYTDLCTYYVQYGAGGSWVDNVYTSAKAGTWTVTAVYNVLADTAPLTVSHGPATAVTLTPTTATINDDGSQLYTVSARDAAGNTWTPPATCLDENGAGSFTDYTYHAAAGDAGHVVDVTATVDGQVGSATLNVNQPMGSGPILAWDKTTRKFYLCANASDPQTGTEITGTGDYGGIVLTVAGLGGTNVTVTSADGSTLRVQWYLRSGSLYRAYQYSTIGGVQKTAYFDGSRTLINGQYINGYWGLAHTIAAGAATYGCTQQP